MITTAEQYNSYLNIIHNTNPPTHVALPTADNIYNIDIKTREIDAPLFLGLEKDHVSETVYFIIDRYADYMDLASTSCIISYINADGESYLYAIPFYDIYTYASINKMIIPWNLTNSVTKKPGTVKFTITFFKTDEQFDEEEQRNKEVISYKLNTKIASSRVLSGMPTDKFEKDVGMLETPTHFDLLLRRIDKVEEGLKEARWPAWTVLD